MIAETFLGGRVVLHSGDSRDVLKTIPDCSIDSIVTDMAAGKAGEYLVCADLILKGHVAFPSEQGLPYDVVAEINGKLYRIQVKTTRGPRNVPQRANLQSAYLFHVTRCGKGGKRANGDADIFALVALDTRTIGYLSSRRVSRTMVFRSSALRGRYKNEIDRVRAVEIKQAYASGKRGSDIAADLGMDHSSVIRIARRPLMKGKGAPYLDELTLEEALA